MNNNHILTAAITLHITGLASITYYLITGTLTFAAGGFILVALSDGILLVNDRSSNKENINTYAF